MPHVTLAGVADPDRERAGELAGTVGTTPVDDVLLAARGDDLVAHLVTDRVPLADALAHLVALADGRRHAGIQTVFTA